LILALHGLVLNGFSQKCLSSTDICTYLSNKHLIVKILQSSEIYEIFAALLCLAHLQLVMATSRPNRHDF